MDRNPFIQKVDTYLTQLSQDPTMVRKVSSMRVNVRIVVKEAGIPLDIEAGQECLRQHRRIVRWSWDGLEDFCPAATLFARQETAEKLLAGDLKYFMALARGRLRVKGRKKAAMDMFKIIESAKSIYQSIPAEPTGPYRSITKMA